MKKNIIMPLLVCLILTLSSNIAFASEEKIKQSKTPKDLHFKKSTFVTEKELEENQKLKKKLVPTELLNNSDEAKPEWTPGDSFGEPTGTNNISFLDFDYGDIILVHDGNVAWGYWRHSGLWDNDYYNGNITDACIWSANPSPNNDVLRETPQKYRNYNEAAGLFVANTTASQRYQTTVFCASQDGERYVFSGAKWNYQEWYCSKLPWAAYQEKAAKDIDSNGGLYVYPDNIYDDTETSLFAHSS